ncbi:MAG: endo alpha-1,4 polygalactosaminidase [Actinomycetota bacterium]
MRKLLVALALSSLWSAGAAPAGAAPAGLPRVATRVAAGPRLADPVPCPGCYAPALRTSWQWQLQGPIDTSFDLAMYDVDGFEVSSATVDDLHAAGSAVVCYLSAGSWEDFRPDAGDFPARVLGRSNGWPGERWLDIRKLGVLGPIMKARLDMCAAKGFDAVEFDNVEGYANHTGFPLTGNDQLVFNVFLANQAHLRGMSAVLKNDLGQIRALLPYYDFALNEQCHQYDECARLRPFVLSGKAVFGVEYKLDKPDFCPAANAENFNFLVKKLSLRVWRSPCRPD